MLRQALL